MWTCTCLPVLEIASSCSDFNFSYVLVNLIRKFQVLDTPFYRLSTNSSAGLSNFEDKRSVLILTYVTYHEVRNTNIIKLIIVQNHRSTHFFLYFTYLFSNIYIFRSAAHHYGDLSYIQYDVMQLLLYVRYVSLVMTGRARHAGF